jgi:hypothetical protein
VKDAGMDVEVLLFDRDGRLAGQAPFRFPHDGGAPARNRR